MLEAKTASTPILLGDRLSRTPMCSVFNTHNPRTKSPISTSQLLPRLLKESIRPRCAKRGLKEFIPIYPPIFTRGLTGCSSKTRPADNTRGKKCFSASMMDVAMAVHHAQSYCYHGRIDRKDIGVDDQRTPIPALRPTQSLRSLDFLIFHA